MVRFLLAVSSLTFFGAPALANFLDEEERKPVLERVQELRDEVKVNFDSWNTARKEAGNRDGILDEDLAWEEATLALEDIIGSSLQERLAKLFMQTKTPECREKIASHLGYYLNAIGKEESLPFSDVQFENECPEPIYMWKDLPEDMHPGMLQNREYQPPRNETRYIDDPKDLMLCYGILTHDDPVATIRLMDVLYEPGHSFVVHVDAKEEYEPTFQAIADYASSREYVHVIDNRVRVNWGGYSMVEATLKMLRYAFAVEGSHDPLVFHKFVHISSSSYPLASNTEIRHRLSAYPLDANFFNTIMQPARTKPYSWHYFVECDDHIHRIYQLPGLQQATAGAELWTSSQWFIASREFANYLADPPENSFVHEYLEYAKHVVVSDEAFFGTVLRNTLYCLKHHNTNFLHLQFDRWESELPKGKRDERKCPMPNPDHCGRSPTVMTLDYADILELSDELFARKVR